MLFMSGELRSFVRSVKVRLPADASGDSALHQQIELAQTGFCGTREAATALQHISPNGLLGHKERG